MQEIINAVIEAEKKADETVRAAKEKGKLLIEKTEKDNAAYRTEKLAFANNSADVLASEAKKAANEADRTARAQAEKEADELRKAAEAADRFSTAVDAVISVIC